MRFHLLLFCTNVYVAAYMLDAGLTAVDELLRSLWGVTALRSARGIVAIGVAESSFLVLLCLLATPRLPRSVLLPYALSGVWFALGAVPLGLLVDSPMVYLVAIQGGIAIAGGLRIRQLNGGRGWLLQPHALSGPSFSWRYSLGAAALTALLLPPLVLGYGVLSVATYAEQASRGFLGFDSVGIWTAERRYARGDQEIVLIGMMHFGERDAYRDLVSSFDDASTLVLEEGISDDLALLERRLSYAHVAKLFGVDEQQPLEHYIEPMSPLDEDAGTDEEMAGNLSGPTFRNADLDVSDFAPETIDWIEGVAELWSSSDPRVFAERFSRQVSSDPGQLAGVFRDILDRRNEHLLQQIQSALPDHRKIIVPWGALHLPDLELAIVDWGFERIDQRQRHLLSWRTIGAALTSSATQSSQLP